MITSFSSIQGCDTTSYFYGVGKIKPFQEIVKNTNVLKLISNLGHIANDDVIKNCEIYIQTVLYNGTSKETYFETRVRHCFKQKAKNSISLPPDPLS